MKTILSRIRSSALSISWLQPSVTKLADIRDGLQVFRYDRRRFCKHRLKTMRKVTVAQVDAKMTYHAHAVEKGLSHRNLRFGFGRSALAGLADALEANERHGFDKSRRACLNAMGTIKAYVEAHSAAAEPGSHAEFFSSEQISEALLSKSNISGVRSVTKESKTQNEEINCRDLMIGRSSIREYSNTPVDSARLMKAISLAGTAPSVCNRQPGRIHVISDPDLIRETLDIQGGFRGYSPPPVLLVVTSEIGAFLSASERNQVYTDGGLFAMSLLLGLEYESLAACPLNAMFSVRREKQLRSVLHLPESENIIMFVAVGNYTDTLVPRSFRFDAEDITHHIHRECLKI